METIETAVAPALAALASIAGLAATYKASRNRPEGRRRRTAAPVHTGLVNRKHRSG